MASHTAGLGPKNSCTEASLEFSTGFGGERFSHLSLHGRRLQGSADAAAQHGGAGEVRHGDAFQLVEHFRLRPVGPHGPAHQAPLLWGPEIKKIWKRVESRTRGGRDVQHGGPAEKEEL